MQLLNIEPRKTEGQDGYVFVLHFLAADGSRPMALLTAAELMSYRQSVVLIVQQTARMTLDHDAEGLLAEQQDRFWRLRVGTFLNGPAPIEQQPKTTPNVN